MIFVVPGVPKPKKRPRVQFFDRHGNKLRKPHTYTPTATTDYEEKVRQYAMAAGMKKSRWIVGPVAVRLLLFLTPKNRTDGDNVMKLVKDALQGLAYENDLQVRFEDAHRIDVKTTADAKLMISVSPLAEQQPAIDALLLHFDQIFPSV